MPRLAAGGPGERRGSGRYQSQAGVPRRSASQPTKLAACRVMVNGSSSTGVSQSSRSLAAVAKQSWYVMGQFFLRVSR